jgi:hypothetical protein
MSACWPCGPCALSPHCSGSRAPLRQTKRRPGYQTRWQRRIGRLCGATGHLRRVLSRPFHEFGDSGERCERREMEQRSKCNVLLDKVHHPTSRRHARWRMFTVNTPNGYSQRHCKVRRTAQFERRNGISWYVARKSLPVGSLVAGPKLLRSLDASQEAGDEEGKGRAKSRQQRDQVWKGKIRLHIVQRAATN